MLKMSKTPGKKLYEKSYDHSGINFVSGRLKNMVQFNCFNSIPWSLASSCMLEIPKDRHPAP